MDKNCFIVAENLEKVVIAALFLHTVFVLLPHLLGDQSRKVHAHWFRMLPKIDLAHHNPLLRVGHQVTCHSCIVYRSRSQQLHRLGRVQQRDRRCIDWSVTAIQVQERRSNTNSEAAPKHETEADLPSTSASRRVAVLKAQKSAALALREGPRPLGNASKPLSAMILIVTKSAVDVILSATRLSFT